MLTGKVTAAAELLTVTQPAVSRLIREFEHSTKLRLFIRQGNRVIPTHEAIALMKAVDRAFAGLDQIATAVGDIARKSAGSLRIAAMPALGIGILPRFLARFLRDKVDVQASLRSMPSVMVTEAVMSGQADIGYAEGPLDRPGLIIRNCPLDAVAALPTDHPLSRKDFIEPHDLLDQRMISLESGSLFSMRVDLALAGIPRSTAIEVRLSHTALTLVREGSGIAIIDPSSACEFSGRGAVMRPFRPSVEAGFLEVKPSNRPTSTLLGHFSEAFWNFHAEQVAELV